MKPIALLAACAALLVAGCGGSSKSSSSTPAPSNAPADTTGSTAGGTTTIKMQNIAFSPGSATVKVGQKVIWTNDDSVDHNVTAKSGASFKSKDFGKGGTYEFTPTKPGTIKYTCTLHPGMDGTLTVTG